MNNSNLVVMDAGIPAFVHSTKMTRLAFLNRLDPELEAIYAAAQSVIRIKIFIDKVLAAEFIDLTDEKTVEGMGALIAGGFITQERSDEIMNSPIAGKDIFKV